MPIMVAGLHTGRHLRCVWQARGDVGLLPEGAGKCTEVDPSRGTKCQGVAQVEKNACVISDGHKEQRREAFETLL